MSSRCPDALRIAALTFVVAAVAACGPAEADRPARTLRVCADPNNLPFSNEAGEGFENRIAAIIAEEMGAEVRYTWWAQRRGFLRNTLNAGECDLVVGVPGSMEMALTTRPYYRSTYVFVTRAADDIELRSFDDEALKRLRIGVHLVGDDGANTPPVHALEKRGVVGNVKGYMLYGDYTEPNPPARLLDALVADEIDVAIAWGPLAGYYASRSETPLELTAVQPQIDLPFMPMVYDIAMGVRRPDTIFRDSIEAIVARRRSDIDRILTEYGVPRMGAAGGR